MTWMGWTDLALGLILMASLWKLDRVEELHHGYYGILLFAFAAQFHWPTWIKIIALLLILDDDVQHVAEALGWVPRMADFTPVHRLGAWLLGKIRTAF